MFRKSVGGFAMRTCSNLWNWSEFVFQTRSRVWRTRSVRRKIGKFALRGCIASFAAFSLVWGVMTAPLFNATYETRRIATHLIAGDTYPSDILREKTEEPSPNALPRYLRDNIILRLHLLEATEREKSARDEDYALLEAMTLEALASQPSDGYLWLILFWLRTLRLGISIESLSALRMSYLYAPYEGWVALPRNRFTTQYFSVLPQDIQDNTVQEFKRLVASGYPSQSAAIMTGPGWPIHDRLLAALADVPDLPKRQFAFQLQRLNDAIRVPGVVYPSNR